MMPGKRDRSSKGHRTVCGMIYSETNYTATELMLL